jgi:cephalosporin hydroxylase
VPVTRAMQRVVEVGFPMAQFGDEILPCAEWLLSRGPLHYVLEIGTDYGGTAVLWCELASDLVISVDLTAGPYGTQELPKDYGETRNGKLSATYPHFCGIIADSHKIETAYAVVSLLGDRKLDLLFIDGDHSLAGVSRDYGMYAPLVRPGGVVLFHDINESPLIKSLNVGVYTFWRALQGDKREFTVNGEWGGLGALVTEGLCI